VRVARLTTSDSTRKLTGAQRQGDSERTAKLFVSALSNRPHNMQTGLLDRDLYFATYGVNTCSLCWMTLVNLRLRQYSE
jgi:hypothetical protein